MEIANLINRVSTKKVKTLLKLQLKVVVKVFFFVPRLLSFITIEGRRGHFLKARESQGAGKTLIKNTVAFKKIADCVVVVPWGKSRKVPYCSSNFRSLPTIMQIANINRQ